MLADDVDGLRLVGLQKRAEAAAYRALAIDPELSEAHGALGTALRDRDPARAEDSYKRALELNPNNIVALWDYNQLLSRDDARAADQEPLLARVRKLDPRLPIVWMNVISEPLEAGKTELFRTEYARALATLADDPDALNLIAMPAVARGMPTEAYQAAFAIEQAGNLDLALTAAILPLMMVEDNARARALLELMRRRGVVPDRTLQLLLRVSASSGDWVAVDAVARDIAALGRVDSATLGPVAFWLSVQGRHADAAEVYAAIGPLQEMPGDPHTGNGAAGRCAGFACAVAHLPCDRPYRRSGQARRAAPSVAPN